MKKPTVANAALAFACTLFLFSVHAQKMDSATYKKALIQFYKRQTTGNQTYEYNPEKHSTLEQDTLFANALVWKKVAIEYPMVLSYLKMKPGTPEAEAKIKYLEDPANSKEREELVKKAAELYAKQNKQKGEKRIAPGLSTAPKSGRIENRDQQIKDSVLKTWKF